MNTCTGDCGAKCSPMMIGYVLVMIGAINWGLVGIGGLIDVNLNVVNLLLGAWPTVESIVYVLVGIGAVAKLIGCRCSTCKGGATSTTV